MQTVSRMIGPNQFVQHFAARRTRCVLGAHDHAVGHRRHTGAMRDFAPSTFDRQTRQIRPGRPSRVISIHHVVGSDMVGRAAFQDVSILLQRTELLVDRQLHHDFFPPSRRSHRKHVPSYTASMHSHPPAALQPGSNPSILVFESRLSGTNEAFTSIVSRGTEYRSSFLCPIHPLPPDTGR
jgi:hypothetical protein